MNKLNHSRNEAKVEILCPCSAPNSAKTAKEILSSNELLHCLPAMYFCNECRSARCKNCLEPEIISKYCPRCTTEIGIEFSECPKNCFCCPNCRTSLIIKAEDHFNEEGQLKGKCFQFDCPLCHYQYNTGLNEKPRSLARILRSKAHENSEDLQFFDTLSSYYARSRELLKFIEKKQTLKRSVRLSPTKPIENTTKGIISSLELAELSLTEKIPEFEAEYEPFEMDPSERKTIAALLEAECVANEASALPQPQASKCKFNFRCRKCYNTVLEIDPLARSTKFASKSLGVERLPKISITPLLGSPMPTNYTTKDLHYLIHFSNPNNYEVNVSVSSFEHVVIRDVTSAQIKIPCSNFVLEARPKTRAGLENMAESLNTVELKDSSSYSRSELLKRSSVVNRLRTPSASNTNVKPLDNGVSWCTIALNIELSAFSKVEGQKINDLQIPFFISLVSTHFNTGYWIVCDLAKV